MLYKSRNFMNMTVMNVRGKKLGYINDILLSFDQNKVTGFSVNPSGFMLAKVKRFSAKDIVYYNRRIVINIDEDPNGIYLSSIKKMEIIDREGNILGIIEDIIFDDKFDVRALIISPGIINKIIVGKRIITTSRIIIGDKNVIYYGKDSYCLYSVRHHMEEIDL
ncbi:PRC-barrel domain-containing protein [Clostridium oryzae]|uniref:PRC-barrel domain protein n=1 Tax=Clostridium oryzae TaxID=1450648 RepID=A0A1V4IUM6_9CLOT|nr:PRC-barrel domain-containing protein [Clostridium oryzae]OPJ63619.1 PRC-barrel domain protein [Clostridium oryzae]